MRSKSFKWRSSTIPHGGAALCCFVWLIVTYITSWSTFVTYPRITMPLCIYWMLEQASAAIYLDVAMDRAYSSWQSQRLCKGETRNQGAVARLPSFSKGWALYGALPWAKGSDKKQIWSKGKQIASTVLDSWSVTIALALQVVQTLWLLLTNWQMLTVTPWFSSSKSFQGYPGPTAESSPWALQCSTERNPLLLKFWKLNVFQTKT